MTTKISCPHCNGKAIARSSRELSKTLREITFICLTPECGHTYVANLEIVRSLSPSARPNPLIHLPMSSGSTVGRQMAAHTPTMCDSAVS